MATKSKTTWALGLPLESTRRLTDQELGALRNAVKHYRLNTFLLWLAYSLAWAAVIFIASRVDPNNSVAQSVLSAMAIPLFIIGLPTIILLTKDWLRRVRLLAGDVKNGHIHRFTGPITDDSADDPAYPKLAQHRLIPINAIVDVLAASGRIWNINGVTLRQWIEVYVADVAAVPQIGDTTIQWLPTPDTSENTRVGKRRLTDAEKEELTHHARHSWTPYLSWVIGFSIWLSMPIAMIIMQGHLDQPLYYVQMAIVSILTLGAYVLLFDGLSTARRFGRDRDEGELAVLEVKNVQGQMVNDEIAGDQWDGYPMAMATDAGVHRREILSHTSLLWSTDGQPAAWRKTHS